MKPDGSPAHTAKVIQQFCAKSFPSMIPKELWPGNSPDLNVIEQLWNVLQESVFGDPKPKNRREVVEQVKAKWSNVSDDYLCSLVESLPKRVKDIRAANGGYSS